MTHTQIDPKEQQQQRRREVIRRKLDANRQTWLDSLRAEKDHVTPEISAAIDSLIDRATKEV
jgi:hypothetical protein